MAPLKTPQLASKEGRMALAFYAYQEGYFSSRRAAVNAYDLPKLSLRYHDNGYPVQRDSKPTNRKLTNTEESSLIQWILSIDQRGLLPRATTIRRIADLLLVKRSTDTEQSIPKVGKY